MSQTNIKQKNKTKSEAAKKQSKKKKMSDSMKKYITIMTVFTMISGIITFAYVFLGF